MAAPKGNTNATKTKPWIKALERVAMQDADTLRRIALKVFQMAEEGDMSAIREIGDRLDGKPVQQVIMDATVEDKTVREYKDHELTALLSRRPEAHH